ncbi:hypothetical protein [Pseudoalteromonas sp. B62]|uniref:hypothetical protein n=1 Tax=Pseudoalteromonas sp. B62 TaxID=630483 RepID=UPI00301C7E74
MELDIKSLVLWGFLGIAVGGGAYGAYVKFFGKTVKTQGQSYISVIECTVLQNSNNKTEINEFLKKYEESKIDIKKSDAVMTGVNAIISQNAQPKAAGMGVPLSMCIEILEKKLQN